MIYNVNVYNINFKKSFVVKKITQSNVWKAEMMRPCNSSPGRVAARM